MPSFATMVRTSPKGSASSAVKRKFRLDIQGLRAFAVVSVILDHLFAWPSGGFVGVDIFFVISGFLITGHLMREWEKSGRISFRNFYVGRIKRILPAATLVLVLTVVASFLLLNKSRAMSVLWDGVWASLFSGNWRFAAAGTDYFQADGPVSPLQHFWSLAVEEQFYFAWPWAMLLALIMVGRSTSAKIRPRVVVGLLLAGLSAASFAWAMFETVSAPAMAYFSTFSRAWELGVGAILAIASPLLLMIRDQLRPALAWAGVAGMVTSVFVINSSQAFPAPTALLPVLATALIIAAGTGGEQRYLYPLTNPVSAYIGNISYSLYLWHFPVIIFGAALAPEPGAIYYAVTLLAMAAASVFAYHLVEDPIRKSAWLTGGRRKKRMAGHAPTVSTKTANMWLAFLAVTAMGCVAWAMVGPASTPAPAASSTDKMATSKESKKDKPTDRFSPAVAEVQEEIETALATTKWPKLTPSIDELGRGSLATEWVTDGCLGGDSESLESDIAKAETCVYGDPDASKSAVVVGDSIGISYVPAVRAALEPKGYKIVVYTMQECPAVMVTVSRGDKSEHTRCNPFRDWAFSQVQAAKPDILILASSLDATGRLSSKAEGIASVDEWLQGTKDTLAAVAGSAGKIVLLDPPPGGKGLQECATRLSKPGDCVTSPSTLYRSLHSAIRTAAAATPAANAEVISTTDWFCSANMCPPFVSDIPVYADRSHLSSKYASSLGPLLASALKL